MKKFIYIFSSIILGSLLSFLLHFGLEMIAIYFFTKDFYKYSLGLSWSTWMSIHYFGTFILIIAGIIFGYWLGQNWWRIIYVEKKYQGWWKKKSSGFTLIELLVVIAVIGLLVTISVVSLGTVTKKSRDTKRKADLSQIGRFLSSSSCFLPNAGMGEYDIADLFDELIIKYPQYSGFISHVPRDPKIGTESESYYHYLVSEEGKKCAIYANLENADEPVTIGSLSSPTPGGGTGVLQGSNVGWNNTNKYFQVSN